MRRGTCGPRLWRLTKKGLTAPAGRAMMVMEAPGQALSSPVVKRDAVVRWNRVGRAWSVFSREGPHLTIQG